MKKSLITLALAMAAMASHAGLTEAQQAQAKFDASKAELSAAKKGLSKVEKAQLAVAAAQARLDKAQGKAAKQ